MSIRHPSVCWWNGKSTYSTIIFIFIFIFIFIIIIIIIIIITRGPIWKRECLRSVCCMVRQWVVSLRSLRWDINFSRKITTFLKARGPPKARGRGTCHSCHIVNQALPPGGVGRLTESGDQLRHRAAVAQFAEVVAEAEHLVECGQRPLQVVVEVAAAFLYVVERHRQVAEQPFVPAAARDACSATHAHVHAQSPRRTYRAGSSWFRDAPR